MTPVRYTARTSKSERTGIGFSTIGVSKIPGMIIASPALTLLADPLLLALRMAAANSAEVKYEVLDR